MESKYTIETTNPSEMNLYTNAFKMADVLHDILNWRNRIYNGNNYGEGSVLYRGKLYSKNEWNRLEHSEDEYDETVHFLKDKVVYLYTDEELEKLLGDYLDGISNIIYDYFNE